MEKRRNINHRSQIIVSVIGLAITFSSLPLSAAEKGFIVGAGIGYKDKPYRDYDNNDEYSFVPLLRYEGEHFFIRDTTIGWDYLNNDRFELAVIGKYIKDGYDSSDSDFLNGMSDRDPSFGVGGQARLQVENFGFQLVAASDVADKSDGSQVIAGVNYRIPLGNVSLTPYINVVWQD